METGRVPEERLRLLAVHAHPDDEASKGAATVARYVREGVDVLIATCTGGERGSILNPAMDRPDVIANLAGVRHHEMERAIANLLPPSRQRARDARAIALAVDGAIVHSQFEETPDAALKGLDRLIKALQPEAAVRPDRIAR